MIDYLTMALAFGPAAILVGCALWAKFREPPPTGYDDFLERPDHWGRQ